MTPNLRSLNDGFAGLPPAPGAGMALGYLAMGWTVLVWAAFALTTRVTDASALAFGDVALCRSLVPTLVFLPFMRSRVAMIRRAGARNCTVICVGAGLPFFWLAVAGGAQTSAAHVSALIAGTVPVCVAILLWLSSGVRPTRRALGALGLIVIGVVFLVGPRQGNVALVGMGVLLLASLCWSAFTVAFKRSGLDPIGCAIVVSVPSTGAVAALMLIGAMPSNWGSFTALQAMPFIVIHGICVSTVSILTYAFAIAQLGSARCAALGSVAPALAALMAVPILNEHLDLATAAAIGTLCLGVFLSARAAAAPAQGPG